MKKQIFLLVAMFIFVANSAMAQIKYSGGNININDASKNTFYGLAVDKWPGMYWTCKDNNFFQLDVTPSSPRLAGTGNEIVFFNTETGTFNSIQVGKIYNYSDARAKENVHTINNGLSTISSLKPISYSWKAGQYSTDSISGSIPTGPADKGTIEYGFSAQEVEKILPNIVKTDDSGIKLVNYTAIIPFLVKAVQEMKKEMEKQAVIIEKLLNSSQSGKLTTDNKILSCVPDKSCSQLTVTTQLDEKANDARLVISSMTGEQERSIPVSTSNPTVTENISTLQNGVHIVGLYVDNSLTDSKNWMKE